MSNLNKKYTSINNISPGATYTY